MSFRLEHYRSSSTSQLVSRPSFEESSRNKEARSRESRLSERGKGPTWRPWTLHPTTLLATLTFTLGIIGILEYLQRISDAKHGLLFASSRDAIPDTSSFLYLYLPTLIAVLYSTWWSWVDLDVKRLEPWYQLISTKRVKARCSLLLQYPIEFIAWIPVRAARKKYVDYTPPPKAVLYLPGIPGSGQLRLHL